MRRIASLLLIAMLGWCAGGVVQAQERARGPIVLAAASLQEALGHAADVWTAKGNTRPVISFAASSALAKQIAAGAPADIFISADEQWMDELATRHLIRPGTRQNFLGNHLVLIAPASSRIRLTIGRNFPLVRALGDGRLAMADPDSVPAGRYGRAALTKLGLWKSVEPRIARAENVRAALLLVERGEAPFGIVYATDARASTAVRVIGTFPANTHAPITYPLAMLSGSRVREADGFMRFLRSREGRVIFLRYGFSARE